MELSSQILGIVGVLLFGGIGSLFFSYKLRAKFFGFFGIIAGLWGLGISLNLIEYSNDFYSIFNLMMVNQIFFGISSLGIIFFSIYNMSLAKIKSASEQQFRLYHLIVSIFASTLLVIPTLIINESFSNNICFYAVWEIMSITSFLFMLFNSNGSRVNQKAIYYLVTMHISAIFLMFGFIALSFSEMKTLGTIFLIVGFAFKMGLFPFHFWMTEAYDNLPGASAGLVSGVMVNMGVYGIIISLGATKINHDIGYGYAFAIIGAITGLYGVVLALTQRKMKKLLAGSSMENMGLILITISMILISQGTLEVAYVALVFHLLNHSILKSMLFYGANMVENATKITNMNLLGGLDKRLKFLNFNMLLGSMGISALPPLNGFIGKFFMYVSAFYLLMNGVANHELTLIIYSALILIVLGVIGAIGVFAFVKFYTVNFVGTARSEYKDFDASVENIYSKIALSLMTICCLILGFFPYLLKFFYSASIYKLLVTISSINIILFIAITLVVILRKTLLKNRSNRLHNTWCCGYKKYTPKLQYTADGLTLPLMWLLDKIFLRKENRIEINEIYPKNIDHEYAQEELIKDKLIHKSCCSLLSKLDTMRFIQSGAMQSYLWISVLFIVALLIYAIFIK